MEVAMKQPWLAALLNFFLMGAGTAYNGRRTGVGIGLTVGAIALTYVEMNLQSIAPNLYWVMFAGVFLINTCLAYDGYTEAQSINGRRMAV
jgi:hypothetical protein